MSDGRPQDVASPALAYALRILTMQREGWADATEKAGQGKRRLALNHGPFKKLSSKYRPYLKNYNRYCKVEMLY